MARAMRPGLPLVLALGAAACAADLASPPVRPDVPIDLGKGDFAASSTLWPSPRIAVCWEAPSLRYGEERAWVEDAVRGTWSAVSAVELVGWGPCASGERGIHVGTTDAAPNTLGLGTNLDGVAFGMRLNFEFLSWSTGCQQTREFCVRAGAAHEFGHALGFAHEQNRPDTPGWCAGERGAFGDLSFTDWDLDSIMNYCNPAWTGSGNLSTSDVIAVRALYGRDAGTVLVARSDGATLGPEWVFAEDAALARLGPQRALLLGDVTGDRRADVVAFDPDDGTWLVLESTGEEFLPGHPFAAWTGTSGVTALLGDLNGDGLADAVDVDTSGAWTVGLSDGNRFGAPRWIGTFETMGTPLAADVDGDGRDDAILANRSSGTWWVALSVGTGLASSTLFAEGLGAYATEHLARDVTGDTRVDFVAVFATGGTWRVAASRGMGIDDPRIWTSSHGAAASVRLLADLSGDGRADALAYERERGRWFARRSNGDGFAGDELVATSFGTSRAEVQPTVRAADVDGDGRDDIVLIW